ncbi:hypothetical protein WICMUC_001109 [Wickerhamomyces mucosus]|uniref:Protein SOP4 n=1 Tax=Wickerhamomyces mucosus TaxID=1378264 RepID=A0A9P8PX98_9ASCO|nr:hypothetical protein WICMUC_001109 [Wickerhamomyces mucosus]
MNSLISLILFTSILIGHVFCATINGQINFPENITSIDIQHTTIELIKISELNHSIESSATNFGLKRKTLLQENSNFEFKHIPNGEYLLNILSIDYNFNPNKLKIVINEEQEDNDQIIKAYIYRFGFEFNESIDGDNNSINNNNNNNIELSYPLIINTHSIHPERIYIKPRQLSILEWGPLKTILGNRLYLVLSIVTIFLMVGPLILEKFDPETAKLMKEQRSGTNGVLDPTNTEFISQIKSNKNSDSIDSKPNESLSSASSSTNESGKSIKNRKH